MSTTSAALRASHSQVGADYLALMDCHARDGWLPRAEGQLADWLRDKKSWELDTKVDGTYQQGDRSIQITHHDAERVRSLWVKLVEVGRQGTWTTEMVAHDKTGAGDWIALSVQNDQGRFVEVPWLAKYLLRALPLGDGALEFTDGPQVFGTNRVEELVEVLSDTRRHGQVMVAGTDMANHIPFDPYVANVARWTYQVQGLAQVVVLDPSATRAFAAAVGESHEAAAGTIRTYLPGVDVSSTIDGRRHRILGAERLAGSNRDVRRLFGTVARAHSASRLQATEVTRVGRLFERLNNQAIVAAISVPSQTMPTENELALPRQEQRPRPRELPVGTANTSLTLAAQVERYLAEIQLAKAILCVDTLDEPTLRSIADSATRPQTDPIALDRATAQIKLQQERIEIFEDDVRDLGKLLEEEQIDHAVTAEEAEKRNDEVRYLRAELRERGAFDVIHSAVPDKSVTHYPSSFSDLLERARLDPSGVIFTGVVDNATELDNIDSLRKCCRTAWDAILTLRDYVRARVDGNCVHGLDSYLSNTPLDYRTFPPSKFAQQESSNTMARYGDERKFPVPKPVDASGCATMVAHFKLGKIGMVSPRMYILDDFCGTGLVYIGYIGRHLTNTQTN
jgi:hypothetical protein